MASTATSLTSPEYPGPGVGITDTCGLCRKPFDLMYPPEQYPTVTVEGEMPELICDGCQDAMEDDRSEAPAASPYVADPANPTSEELDAAIQRSLQAGTLVDAATWMARELGAQHGSEDTAPFGDLDDAGSGDLMTALGEAGETTDGNFGGRLAMLDAYRDAWEAAAGRFYPAGGGKPCGECGALIPDDEPDEVNDSHRATCSLHPASVVRAF